MITDEELMNLPNDPAQAFIQLEKLIRDKTFVRLNRANSDSARNEYRLDYINAVLGAAKAYGIAPYKDWTSPSINGDVYGGFKRICSEVDYLAIQVRIQNIPSVKKYSVVLDNPTKEKIRHYISQIKVCVDESDLSENKKDSLYNKLSDLEKEVDKNRTGWQAGMDVFVAVCAGIGQGIEKLEPARKWVESIAALMGNAKEVEQAQLMLTQQPQKMLEAPTDVSPASNENLDDGEKEIA